MLRIQMSYNSKFIEFALTSSAPANIFLFKRVKSLEIGAGR